MLLLLYIIHPRDTCNIEKIKNLVLQMVGSCVIDRQSLAACHVKVVATSSRIFCGPRITFNTFKCKYEPLCGANEISFFFLIFFLK